MIDHSVAGRSARSRVLLLGVASARPEGLERALVRAGFDVLEDDRLGLDPTDIVAPDVLLLTVPGDGADVTGVLQTAAARWGRSLPRLVVSATANGEAIARALEQGADDAMGAPIHFPELIARLRARLRLEHRAAAGAHPRPEGSACDLAQEVYSSVRVEEILHALVQRVSRALDLAHCSFVLTPPGTSLGRVVAESTHPGARDGKLDLGHYPEVLEAVRTGEPVCRRLADPELAVDAGNVVALPVALDGQVVGVFLLHARDRAAELTPAQVAFADSLARTAARVVAHGAPSGVGVADPERIVLDPLTGCATAASLSRRIQDEFARARRYSLSFSLVLVDVDRLRAINDRFGTATGDRFLAELGELFQQELRAPDFVSRYGGDEFAIVLPETGHYGARSSVARLWQRVGDRSFAGLPDASRPRLTAGIVTYPHPAAQATDDLLALVEAALLRGKAQSEERIGTAEAVG